jgi:sterol-4alpha-carboxylate 3-dehydrogenase (decarboxylating)
MPTARIPILITGGCGFLGTEIVSALLSSSRYAITVIDINPPALGTSTFTQHVRYVRCNVLNLPSLESVLAETAPAVVVHTVGVYRLGAARYSMVGKEAEFQVNVEGTRNVVESAKKCGARGLVYTSSVTVVLDEMGVDFRNVDERWPTGRATTSYGQSKVCLCNYYPLAEPVERIPFECLYAHTLFPGGCHICQVQGPQIPSGACPCHLLSHLLLVRLSKNAD